MHVHLFCKETKYSVGIKEAGIEGFSIRWKKQMKVKCRPYWKVDEINSLRMAQMEEFYPNIFLKLSSSQLAVFGALFLSLMVTGGQSTGVCASQKQYLFHLCCLMAHIYSKLGAVFRYPPMEKAKCNSGSASEAKGLSRIQIPTSRDNKYMQSVTREFSLFSARTWCEPRRDALPQ